MNPASATLFGVGSFLVVTGLLTLGVVLACIAGLVLAWRRRGPPRELARAEGWRYAGGGRFEGRVGESDWRGGARSDSDDGSCWTEFESGGAALFPGGFAIRSTAAWREHAARRAGPAAPVLGLVKGLDSALNRVTSGLFDDEGARGLDDPDGWQPVAAPQPDARWAAQWQVVASEPHWAAAVTPAVQALWLQAAALHGGELKLQVHRRRLWLHRDDGRAEPTLAQVAALLRLGQAVLASALAAGEARHGAAHAH